MISKRTLTQLLLASAFATASISCGDVVRDGRSPVFLVIDLLQGASGADPTTVGNPVLSDVLTLVTTGGTCTVAAPCPTTFNDVGSVTLRIVPKDLGTTATPNTPTTNNEVTITRYHVTYRRADGRNTPGTDVPYSFDSAVTGTVGASGTLTLGFELVRNVAKLESPLVQLVTNRSIITVIADVTFYGKDRVGNEVNTTGSIQISFGNFGDA